MQVVNTTPKGFRTCKFPCGFRTGFLKESRENGEEVETCQALEKLKELNFVAIVRGHGSTWNSPHCRCDLSVLAVLAPALEKSLGTEGKMSQEKTLVGWVI